MVIQHLQSYDLILYEKIYVWLMRILETQQKKGAAVSRLSFSARLRVLRDKQNNEAVKFQQSVYKLPHNPFNERPILYYARYS